MIILGINFTICIHYGIKGILLQNMKPFVFLRFTSFLLYSTTYIHTLDKRIRIGNIVNISLNAGLVNVPK